AKARSELPDTTIVMWFSDVQPVRLADEILTLSVPSPLVRERLQHHHLGMIEDAAEQELGHPVKIEFEVTEGSRHPLGDAPEPMTPHEERAVTTGTQVQAARPAPSLGAPGLPFPNYTFDAFVPGPSNRFAHAAAMAVAEAPPSKAYNPLFIYGGVGLGKTHLLVAIGHQMHQLSPRSHVKYVTSESFMAEFIKAVRERQGYQFAARYRDI